MFCVQIATFAYIILLYLCLFIISLLHKNVYYQLCNVELRLGFFAQSKPYDTTIKFKDSQMISPFFSNECHKKP